MGVLNVTPDSFFDGGSFFDQSAAVDRAQQMVEEGAEIIDIGGESTRPGAEQVSAEEESGRVVPVIAALAGRTGAAISIDTSKAPVARAALDAGAVIVNDISALRFDPAMAQLAAEAGAGVVLMHMQGRPRTMQANPTYRDVVADVKTQLLHWADGAQAAGIAPERIAIDPGIGFGKNAEHNLALIRATDELCSLGYPVVLGASRKSFIGMTLDLPVEDRLEGTAAVVAWAVANGAQVVRVHDVKEMARVVRMTEAIKRTNLAL